MDYNKPSTQSKATNKDIVDVDLTAVRKQRFRINIDDNYDRENNILELNTSDLSIVDRVQNLYGKLEEYEKQSEEMAKKLEEAEADENVSEEESTRLLAEGIKDIDSKMRSLIDEIFDAPVSSVCVPSGTMFDPINGKVRYEYIFDKIANLYEQGLAAEMRKMAKNTAKHTNKYTKKKYTPKKK